MVTSVDGKDWATEFEDDSYTFNSVASRGDTMLAVAEFGGVLRFVDKTHYAIGRIPAENHLRGVAWAGSLFVAVGEGMIATSSDGKAWDIQAQGWGWDLKRVRKIGADWFAYSGYGDRPDVLHDGKSIWTTRGRSQTAVARHLPALVIRKIGVGEFSIYQSANGTRLEQDLYGHAPALRMRGERRPGPRFRRLRDHAQFARWRRVEREDGRHDFRTYLQAPQRDPGSLRCLPPLPPGRDLDRRDRMERAIRKPARKYQPHPLDGRPAGRFHVRWQDQHLHGRADLGPLPRFPSQPTSMPWHLDGVAPWWPWAAAVPS